MYAMHKRWLIYGTQILQQSGKTSAAHKYRRNNAYYISVITNSSTLGPVYQNLSEKNGHLWKIYAALGNQFHCLFSNFHTKELKKQSEWHKYRTGRQFYPIRFSFLNTEPFELRFTIYKSQYINLFTKKVNYSCIPKINTKCFHKGANSF